MISTELINYMGNDLTVVNAARVSFAKESNWETEGTLNERDQRLIRYLGTHSVSYTHLTLPTILLV